MFDKILQTREFEMKTSILYNLNNMNKIHPQVNIFVGWQSLLCQQNFLVFSVHGASGHWSFMTFMGPQPAEVCWPQCAEVCWPLPVSATPKLVSPMSAAGGKLVKPMMTLVEEQHHREIKPLLHQDTEEVGCCDVIVNAVQGGLLFLSQDGSSKWVFGGQNLESFFFLFK